VRWPVSHKGHALPFDTPSVAVPLDFSHVSVAFEIIEAKRKIVPVWKLLVRNMVHVENKSLVWTKDGFKQFLVELRLRKKKKNNKTSTKKMLFAPFAFLFTLAMDVTKTASTICLVLRSMHSIPFTYIDVADRFQKIFGGFHFFFVNISPVFDPIMKGFTLLFQYFMFVLVRAKRTVGW